MADDIESGACRKGATETDATQTISAGCFIHCVSGIYGNNPIHSWLTTHACSYQSGEDIYGGLLDRFTQ